MTVINNFKKIVLLIALTAIVGCSATHTAIKKRNLDVQTKMSASIFLDPVAPEKRTVFLQVKNTSDKQALDVESKVREVILSRGYKIVDDPEQANYMLQANVLRVGNVDLRDAEGALNDGFGASLPGALLGAGAGAIASGHRDAVVIGAIVGGAISLVSDAIVKDVSYSAITDLQVSERIGKNVRVKEKTKSTLKQGTSGNKIVTSNERVRWKKYQTRVVSTANKANLKFEEAESELVSGLTRSIAGIF